jgi:hypothetical protein
MKTYYQVHVILCKVNEVETDILHEDEPKGFPHDYATREEAVKVYNEVTGLKIE